MDAIYIPLPTPFVRYDKTYGQQHRFKIIDPE